MRFNFATGPLVLGSGQFGASPQKRGGQEAGRPDVGFTFRSGHVGTWGNGPVADLEIAVAIALYLSNNAPKAIEVGTLAGLY